MATKDTKKPTSKTTLTWVSDKLAAGAARVNGGEYQDVEVAIVKATNHDLVPPKEKHVRTLRECINAAPSRRKVIYIIHDLYERLKSSGSDWLIVLKTLMVFHKLIKTDIDSNFQVEILKYKEKRKLNSILKMDNFSDNTDKEGWDFSAWIRVYSIYLDERLNVFDTIKFDLEKDVGGEDTRFKKASEKVLLEELPKIQKLLQRVLACVPYGVAAESAIVMDCLKWVLTECFRLYRAISEGVINLAEIFFDMEKVSARKGLEIYKEALNSTQQLHSFFSSIQALSVGSQMTFPQLTTPPEDFLIQMEEFLNGNSSNKDKMPARVARTIKGDLQTSAFDKNKANNIKVVTRNIPITNIASKQENIVQETDLLSLDDPTTVNNSDCPKDDYVSSNQNPDNPFGDSAFTNQGATNLSVTPSSNKSAPIQHNTASNTNFLDDWGLSPSNSQPQFINQNEGTKSVLSAGDAPNQSSPFDDFFGGGPMAQPPPPPSGATFAPPAYAPPIQNITNSSHHDVGFSKDLFNSGSGTGNPFSSTTTTTMVNPVQQQQQQPMIQNPYNSNLFNMQNSNNQSFGINNIGTMGVNHTPVNKMVDPFLDLSSDVLKPKSNNSIPAGEPMRSNTGKFQKIEPKTFPQNQNTDSNPFINNDVIGNQGENESGSFF